MPGNAAESLPQLLHFWAKDGKKGHEKHFEKQK